MNRDQTNKKLEIIDNKLNTLIKSLKVIQNGLDELMAELDAINIADNYSSVEEMRNTGNTANGILKSLDINQSSGDAEEFEENKLVDKSYEQVSKRPKERKADKDKGFNVPFISTGTTYSANYIKDKDSGRKLKMKIQVLSSGRCKILKGSNILLGIEYAKGISKETLETLESITSCSSKYKVINDEYMVAELLEDVLDVKVATAATLFFGKAKKSSVFRNIETGEVYQPTRKNTPKNTRELESYIFNNTK